MDNRLQYLLYTAVLLAAFAKLSYAQDGFQGSFEAIPNEIAKKMLDHTWHSGCPLPLNKMSYLTLTYWGFDHKPHEGHLIVLNNLVGETLQIFQELYQIKFPIEKMELPDSYASKKNDWVSIDWRQSEDNNTAGFLCRNDDQSLEEFSPHSYGIAIDINPVYNPSKVANNKIQPVSGGKYLDRILQHQGMINEQVVAIFARYGWKWGGYWSPKKIDYMHFQKDMDAHYMCQTLVPVIKE